MLLPLAKAVLKRPVTGVNLAPGTLADQLGPGPTLLVFLRHFGCIFCRETVSELRRVGAADPTFPPVLFFFQGTPTAGRAFLRRYWPEARAVADPAKELYAAFGIGRGGLRQLFGPAVWAAVRRARRKGLSQGRPSGDLWMMPGLFLVRDGAIVWAHEYAHAGDQPDFECIPSAAGIA